MPESLKGNWAYHKNSIAYEQAMSCEGGFQSRRVTCKKKGSAKVHDKVTLVDLHI